MDCKGALQRYFQNILYILDAKVVKKQWKNHNNCVVTILKSSSRFVVAIANSNDSPCTRSFSLSGLPTKRITEGNVLFRPLGA